MRTSSLLPMMGRRLSVAGLVLAATAALVATMWITSPDGNAAAAPTPAASSTDDLVQLRADLKAARALDGDARREAVQRIGQDAKSGTYGDAVEKRIDRRSELRADRRAVVTALLPGQMRQDLAAARDVEDAEDRKAELQGIRAKALDGGYGDQVKEAAELAKQQRADRRADR